MADDQKYPVRLYDANGQHVADAEHDEDLSAAATRGGTVEAGGKTYVWDQRNGQWRESSATYKLGSKAVEKVEPEAATAVTTAPEKK
jgi:hypothetical protein